MLAVGAGRVNPRKGPKGRMGRGAERAEKGPSGRDADGRRRASPQLTALRGTAGIPAANVWAGMSLVTTLPAATNEPGPMLSPRRMVAPAPMKDPCLITTGAATAGKWRWRGWS